MNNTPNVSFPLSVSRLFVPSFFSLFCRRFTGPTKSLSAGGISARGFPARVWVSEFSEWVCVYVFLSPSHFQAQQSQLYEDAWGVLSLSLSRRFYGLTGRESVRKSWRRKGKRCVCVCLRESVSACACVCVKGSFFLSLPSSMLHCVCYVLSASMQYIVDPM